MSFIFRTLLWRINDDDDDEVIILKSTLKCRHLVFHCGKTYALVIVLIHISRSTKDGFFTCSACILYKFVRSCLAHQPCANRRSLSLSLSLSVVSTNVLCHSDLWLRDVLICGQYSCIVSSWDSEAVVT